MRSQRSSPRRQSVKGFGGELCVLSARPLRHVLAYAEELRRRVIVNREATLRVAKSLRFDVGQVAGAVRLLRLGHFSLERLALIAMHDPGLEDADIAEMFGQSPAWATDVRSRANELRLAEPIPEALEWFDPCLRPWDPTPEEILRRAKEVRGQGWVPVRCDEYRPGIRSYSWRGDRASFISVGVA